MFEVDLIEKIKEGSLFSSSEQISWKLQMYILLKTPTLKNPLHPSSGLIMGQDQKSFSGSPHDNQFVFRGGKTTELIN